MSRAANMPTHRPDRIVVSESINHVYLITTAADDVRKTELLLATGDLHLAKAEAARVAEVLGVDVDNRVGNSARNHYEALARQVQGELA